MSEKMLSVSYHLKELRIRLAYVFISFCSCFICCYYYSEELFYLLASPLMKVVNQSTISTQIIEKDVQRYFIYTDVTEAFEAYIKISLAVTAYICLPVFIYHLWMFLLPGLYEHEKKKLRLVCGISFVLFSLGIFIAYSFIFPIACKFFLGFEVIPPEGTMNLRLQPKINEYVSLIVRILFWLGLCFQFPIYTVLLTRAKILSSKNLTRKRHFAMVFFLILAALLTPPDVVSQIVLVIPILFFYEVSIFVMKLLEEYQRIKKS